ncbi:thioesterase II family protein [Planctobacterium marinum]|uniref:thioesterase II family protein n=1 Tax=Planctobacterium marinum TaxID=1631968 RepID=UPI001E4EB8CB|nr:alpha/beta fold hydrolase [Planctobacterium marinum]MCC2607755.1 alpha/beta fold hydrolase [Planctobacterium marinum]
MAKKLFIVPKAKPLAKLRLFCFSYAGGSPATYMSWANHIHADVELVLVQLPGRGERIREAAYTSMDDIIRELLTQQDYITSKPYVLFGHSLGARVAWELALNIAESGGKLPLHLIASGSGAPHVPRKKPPIHHLPEAQFFAKLGELNGTPSEILENRELMEFLTPLLRADFKVAECYLGQQKNLPLPISVFHGREDQEISEIQLNGWQSLTSRSLDYHYFDGDHFFINELSSQVIDSVNTVMGL